MKIFSFVKKVFVLGLTVLLNFTNALKCISMKTQKCKVRPEIISINTYNPMFYPLVLKEINVVVIVLISMIHMQEFVFPIL